MQNVSNDNFGPLVAYLVPGATVLLGLRPYFPLLERWFAATPPDAPTLGGFLYLTVASLAIGMTLNAIRWAVVDTVHALTGLPPPELDFSRLFGKEWFSSNLSLRPLSKECVQCRDWIKSGVDIAREFGTSRKWTSIHDFLNGELVGSPADVVIYDHRPGEVADFVVLYRQGTVIRCELIHCKGAGGDKPGSRVGDAYEVAGQIVKCVGWAKSPSGLSGQMTRRLATGSKLLKGDLALLEQLLSDAERTTFECRIILVQPGISYQGITDEVSHVLAGAYEYVVGTTGLPPSLWLSD